jgi:hypothetical protein
MNAMKKICQKCNNKCPMCRNVLNKELENVPKKETIHAINVERKFLNKIMNI